jgi:nitrate/TMAO reductase-like tetraheme cytochrome c subunit
VIALVVIALFSLLSLNYAEYRTSQSSFCASCHIMTPYYETWQADMHGAKLDVACVECHYAPGERTTLKAKFRGLSQVTSYFSGRFGATRPRAYVSNTSCLTSKCHGDQAFMNKPILLGTVRFTHANHLARSDELERPKESRLAELTTQLTQLVGDERIGELETIAQQAVPAQDRLDALMALCRGWNVAADSDMLLEYSQLHHRAVRLAQLRDLQCTNCHSYHATDQIAVDGNAGHHFQVSTSTCFTCHFNNEGYNTGTSTCLNCHTPPQQDITVHAEMMPRPGGQDNNGIAGTRLVKMNHTELLAKNVACISCHADAIQTDATVTRRDCERCHDQPRFFADWEQPYTLDLVEHYHEVHIERQKAKCLDCHAEIQHQLVRGEGEFLTSALADCSRCHPNHHVAQVDLLLGRGGVSVPKSEPNLMFGSRTNCAGCHTAIHGDDHGEVLRATEQSCVACHGERYADTFEKWKVGLQITQLDAEEAYNKARAALEQATDASVEARRKAADLLSAAQADLVLVQRGKGVHNVSYAIELLDAVTRRSQEAVAALSTRE